VIGQPTALHAPVIDNIAETKVPHVREYNIPCAPGMEDPLMHCGA
jgi:hypothetical protein